MPQIELRPRSVIKPESMVLDPYRGNVTSQCGEDGIIERIFEIIGTANKWCVEFGACDGKDLSNTWNLINNHGWHGVLIEADDTRFQELQTTYKELLQAVCLMHTRVGLNPDPTLDHLMDVAKAPDDIDFLSIDIDGNDWHVWNSLIRYHPRVVVVEFNPTADNDFLYVQDYDPAINQGSSLLGFVELGKLKGYELVAATDWNAFFVKSELFERFGIADNSPDALHQPTYLTKILQGFDGTIVAAGLMELIWPRVPLTQEDFQVLDTGCRKYPGRLDRG